MLPESTLIQAILGILPRQSGEVYFLGQPLQVPISLPHDCSSRLPTAAELLFDRRIPDYGGRTGGLGWDRLGFSYLGQDAENVATPFEKRWQEWTQLISNIN